MQFGTIAAAPLFPWMSATPFATTQYSSVTEVIVGVERPRLHLDIALEGMAAPNKAPRPKHKRLRTDIESSTRPFAERALDHASATTFVAPEEPSGVGWGDASATAKTDATKAEDNTPKRSKHAKKGKYAEKDGKSSAGRVSEPYVSDEMPGGSRDRLELRGVSDPARQVAWLAARVETLLQPDKESGEATRSADAAERAATLWAVPAATASADGSDGESPSSESLVHEPRWPASWLLKALGASRPGEADWLDLAACSVCDAGATADWSLHSPATSAVRDRALPALVAQAVVAEHRRRAPSPAEGGEAAVLRAALPIAWQHPGVAWAAKNCLRVLVVCSSARRCTDLLRALQPLRCRAAKLWAKHMKPSEQLADLGGEANTLRKKSVPDSGGRGRGRGGWQRGRGRGRGGSWRDGVSTRPPPSVAVGTPGRLLELAARGAFGVAAAATACPVVTGKPANPASLVQRGGSLGAPPMCVVVDLAGDGKGFTALTPGQAGIGDAAAHLLLALCAPPAEAVEIARTATAFRPTDPEQGTAAASKPARESSCVQVDTWVRPRVLLV